MEKFALRDALARFEGERPIMTHSQKVEQNGRHYYTPSRIDHAVVHSTEFGNVLAAEVVASSLMSDHYPILLQLDVPNKRKGENVTQRATKL